MTLKSWGKKLTKWSIEKLTRYTNSTSVGCTATLEMSNKIKKLKI